MAFYNTAKLTGFDLSQAIDAAATQKDAILEIFKVSKNLTPSQVLYLSGRPWLITSIRRAIHDLTTEGELEKTERQVAGMHGKPEHVWRWVEKLTCQPPRIPRWDEISHYNRFHREG